MALMVSALECAINLRISSWFDGNDCNDGKCGSDGGFFLKDHCLLIRQTPSCSNGQWALPSPLMHLYARPCMTLVTQVACFCLVLPALSMPIVFQKET